MQYSNPHKSPNISELFSLQGRTALIVGGAGLLGGEISYALADLGARVIVASRDLKKCQNFTSELKIKYPEQNHLSFEVDISNFSSIAKLSECVAKVTDGKLNILVNAGWSGKKNTFETISNDDWDSDIEICLNGVFRTIKAHTPLLKASHGVILNIGSMYGHVAPDYRLYDSDKFANPPSYGAAKAGVIQLTKYIASFLSPYGIRANCISPGPFPFEKTQIENPDFIERLNAKNPQNRIGKPFELKGAAALLCSDASSYMTGQNLCVDGGWSTW